ncbi:hypothetical protein JAAARDRAFT_136615 [Jaapia argillacea MUCL 33604]|uniref:DNA damage-binding protein 1 n=1 Tax=Jaapia argillacea MUCL 33604 TaxID=933084 RepID=A0A067PTT7_9AGAM|nr:hypothetical protein JAAARDRAFT_136615 [Jaapia argillacea MUCL 33604]
MQALHQELIPASGIEYATSLNLTPSTITDHAVPAQPNNAARHELTPRVLCNVVVARSNLLRIFEVREEPAPILEGVEDEREKRGRMRRGTEAVEGEMEMDQQGEGFVNMGAVKSTGQNDANPQPPTITRFYFVREHRLHGIVTGLDSVKIMASLDDKLDRLLVSFKEAKVALLEWSDAVHDLITVSIHTYERAPQLLSLDSSLFRSELRVDPSSRCAALSLPNDAIAILPFYQSQAELDVMDQDQEPIQARDVPYSPSYILDLNADVDERIHNLIDFVFLPGFNNPTIALICQPQQTWTGRLKEYKDTVRLFIFTLDLITRTYPVITIVDNLPYDSISLLPCATSFGGVLVIAGNAVLYVDQAARRVVLPVNGWAARVSELPTLPIPTSALEGGEEKRNLELEGSRSVFVDDRTVFIILRDGTVYPIEIIVDGKTVSKLTMSKALAQTTIPSVIKRIHEELLLIGSTAGPSVLMKAARVEEVVVGDVDDEPSAPATVVDQKDAMDLDDDDDDIYGAAPDAAPALNGHANGVVDSIKTRSVIHLSLCDTIPGHGPISDITFSMAKNGDRFVPELVAATGVGSLGGFTLFQRDLPTRVKRKLHAIGGARGMWALPVRQAVKVNGISYERPSNPFQSENDTVIVSTDANPSPGLSRIANRSTKADITITTRIPGTTIGAAPFFQRTAILHVMTNSIRVLEPGPQIIKDLENQMTRPKIRHCSISDPFVLVIREDDTLGLFIGETERGKIRRKDMSPMGEKNSRYISGCFFADTTGVFNLGPGGKSGSANGTATTTLQGAVNAGGRSQWLVLVRPQGVMEIWTLPKLTLAFSTTLLSTLQPVLTDSCDPPTPSPPPESPRKPQELDIEQILLAPLGQSSPRPHLVVFLRCGLLGIYETLRCDGSSDAVGNTRPSQLLVRFVKTVSKVFDLQNLEEAEKTVLAEQKKISRLLIPFTTSPTPGTTFSGVFFTGDRPCWILASDKSGARIHPSGHSVVHAFTACSVWESKGDFLLYSDEGPCLLEWMPDLQLGSQLPTRFVPRSRPYSNLAYDFSTSLLVATSSLRATFAAFDEDGNLLWEPDAPNVSYPTCDCSTLELISPDTWVVMDGYEFAQNEFVNALECVTLETSSTESGSKDFIAIGTTIDRGEDLAVKGATYIFEIVEVVADPDSDLKRWYQLRLRCRDDAKGPVTALCGLNGYLVSSMGQKIFVRAFDLDERLVGVAFLDVGIYVTTLRTLKNLLIIGDAVKSISFVAFQEDPYKLVVLGKDMHTVCVTSADFFFADGRMSIAVGDEDGVSRLYDYDPHDPESHNGQLLLCRTEFHGQVESRASVTIAHRPLSDGAIPQSKLVYGSADGSLTALVPVEEVVEKRLQLLHGQLTRNVQHTAGLNPRAHRIVRNDFVSKPLTKGILDGNLLATFEDLPITRQEEMTRQIGMERGVLLRDWVHLTEAW